MIPDHALDRNLWQAAQALLAERGPSFTMAELAAKARVSRATLYRRLGSKQDLLRRLAAARGAPFEAGDTRRRILDAARTVFARHGLVAATMEQIAHEAGLGVATLYRHFGDKESLIRAFVDEMTPRTTLQDLIRQPSQDVAADLTQILRALLAFLLENREVFRLAFTAYEREVGYFRQVRQGSDTLFGLLTAYFRAQMQAGRIRPVAEPEDLALALSGVVLAFALFGPLHYGTPEPDPEAAARRLADLLLDGLRTSG